MSADVGDFLVSPEGEVYLILKKISREHRAFRCLTMEGKIKLVTHVYGPTEIYGKGKLTFPGKLPDPAQKYWKIKAGKKKK